MSAQMQEAAAEMKAENQETSKSDKSETPPKGGELQATAAQGSGLKEDVSSELKLPRWSIVTFEGVAMSGLDYEEALKWLEKLDQQKISGLCIVTDDAAARISK